MRCSYLEGKFEYGLDMIIKLLKYKTLSLKCQARPNKQLFLSNNEVIEHGCFWKRQEECLFYRIEEAGLKWSEIDRELCFEGINELDGKLKEFANKEGRTADDFFADLVNEKFRKPRCPSCGASLKWSRTEKCFGCGRDICERCMQGFGKLLFTHPPIFSAYVCSEKCAIRAYEILEIIFSTSALRKT